MPVIKFISCPAVGVFNKQFKGPICKTLSDIGIDSAKIRFRKKSECEDVKEYRVDRLGYSFTVYEDAEPVAQQ